MSIIALGSGTSAGALPITRRTVSGDEAVPVTRDLPSDNPAMQSELPKAGRKRREALTFLVLAVLIWPFIAVGIVAGWGFVVWMYYLFTGPPGPV